MDGREVRIKAGHAELEGMLTLPSADAPLVLFAHGSGSSRHSPRNREVAAAIRAAGIGTLLFDLLTLDEEAEDRFTGHLRFNIELLAERLEAATEWAVGQGDPSRGVALGYFGASTGAAAALIAASRLQDRVSAVVSRGGRPDLAGPSLPYVTAPTLLIVGGLDDQVIRLNRMAYGEMRCTRELAIVEGATHLFEEPGTLEQVSALAVDWFREHLFAAESPERRRDGRPGSHPRP